MNKEFIPYKQALALKELGFDEPCFGRYQNTEDLLISHTERYVISNGVDRSEFFTLAPLYQQAFRWLRNEYATCWYIQSEYPAFYGLYIHNGTDYDHYVYDKYEEAELECLKKLIEIAKNK